MTHDEAAERARGPTLPGPPANLFLIGIGGIGMSGLAQMLCWRGYAVAGSDRELTGPGRDELYAKLTAQGIRIFPQDGSGITQMQPRAVIYSSAVETDNTDLLAAIAAGVPVIGRAAALAAAVDALPARQLAVAGSCGKTTVTAWLTSALHQLGCPVVSVCGGYMTEFMSPVLPGNFYADPDPLVAVLEVDESDGSLVAFHPHTAVVLNMGRDHYDETKLTALFTQFVANSSTCAVLAEELAGIIAASGKSVRYFAATPRDSGLADAARVAGPYAATLLCAEDAYQTPAGMRFRVASTPPITVPQHGMHSVANAAAAVAALQCIMPQRPMTELVAALPAFGGVHRRFQRVGLTAAGVPVYDDYAHNVEKIAAAVRTAQGIWPAHGVLFAWQPHGYGPLGFMRNALKQALAACLRPGDRLLILPVYYAGGTTSFTPTSADVVADCQAAGLAVEAATDRAEAARWVNRHAAQYAAVVVMGARDAGIHDWVRSLATGGRD